MVERDIEKEVMQDALLVELKSVGWLPRSKGYFLQSRVCLNCELLRAPMFLSVAIELLD